MNGFHYFFQILWKSRREKTPPNNFSVILCVNKNIVVVIQEKKLLCHNSLCTKRGGYSLYA